MTTKASREKNDTDEDGRGQDRVTGAAGQDHARSARDHVTEIVTAEDEKPRVKNVFLSRLMLWSKLHFVTPCCIQSCKFCSLVR